MEKFIFEVICIDTKNEVVSKSIKKILLSLQSSDAVWSSETTLADCTITEPENSLSVKIDLFDTSSVTIGDRNALAYHFEASATDVIKLEPFRMKLIDHLESMKFSFITILHDDASNDIAKRIYPLVNEVENRMRKFVSVALLKKIGEDFIKVVVPSETLDKTKSLKGNEPHFIGSAKVQNDINLLYFDALGGIVYGDSIFNKSKPSMILDKIRAATNLDDLKSELLDGNFQKYFNDCFGSTDFSTTWKRINQLRNKVAHNSFFLECEYNECKMLHGQIITTIENATVKLEKVKLSLDDMEIIKAAVNVPSMVFTDSIDLKSKNEDDNLTGKREHDSRPVDLIDSNVILGIIRSVDESIPFVGAGYLVNDLLVPKGYSKESVWTQINILLEQGLIESYKAENQHGEAVVTAFRIL